MNEIRLYELAELEAYGLLGEAERAELEAWMALDAANAAAYAEVRAILAATSSSLASVDPQTDALWAALDAHIAAEAPQPETIPLRREAAPAAQREAVVIRPPFWSRTRVWSVAAGLALLAVVGYFAFRGPAAVQQAQHFATALGESKEIKLADGSQVRLNGGSTLDAAEGYGAAERRLTLHGEAYFEVAKDKERPFIVKAGATEAQALGTKFNVRMVASDGSVQLGVTEGRVKFSSGKAGERIVEAGQVARFSPAAGFVAEAIPADDAAAWTDNRLIFKDVLFPQAMEQLERSYGVSIQFPERLKPALVSATFDHKSLAEVLAVLSSSYGVKTEQAGKVVTLSE